MLTFTKESSLDHQLQLKIIPAIIIRQPIAIEDQRSKIHISFITNRPQEMIIDFQSGKSYIDRSIINSQSDRRDHNTMLEQFSQQNFP